MWWQVNYDLLSSSSGILLILVCRDSLCPVFYEVWVFSKYSSVDSYHAKDGYLEVAAFSIQIS